MKTTIAALLLLVSVFCHAQRDFLGRRENGKFTAILDTNKLYFLAHDTNNYEAIDIKLKALTDSLGFAAAMRLVDYAEPVRMTPSIYQEADSYEEDYILVKRNDKYGFCDTLGKEVIPCTFDNANAFANGVAVVFTDCKAGIVDKKGEVTPIKRDYNFINNFIGNTSKVQLGDFYGLIDKRGREVVPVVYEDIFLTSNNHYLFVDSLYNQGIMDSLFNIVYLTEDYSIREFNNDLLEISLKANFNHKEAPKKYPQYVEIIKKYKLKPEYTEFVGLIDYTGKTIIEPLYTEVERATYSDTTIFISASIVKEYNKIKFITINIPNKKKITYGKFYIKFFQKNKKIKTVEKTIYSSLGKNFGIEQDDFTISDNSNHYFKNTPAGVTILKPYGNDSVYIPNYNIFNMVTVYEKELYKFDNDIADFKNVFKEDESPRLIKYFIVCDNNTKKVGLADTTGKIVLEPKYNHIVDINLGDTEYIKASADNETELFSSKLVPQRKLFYSGIYKLSDRYGFISIEGALSSKNDTTHFKYIVVKNKKLGVLDYTFKEIIAPQYYNIDLLSKDVYKVKLGKNKYKILNYSNNNRTESDVFTAIQQFENKKYLITYKGKQNIIDSNYRQILPKYFDKIIPYSYTKSAFLRAFADSLYKNAKINWENDKEVDKYLEENFLLFMSMESNIRSIAYVVADKNKLGIYDNKGNQLSAPIYKLTNEYKNIDSYRGSRGSSEYFIVKNKKGKEGMVNLTNGKIVFPTEYRDIANFKISPDTKGPLKEIDSKQYFILKKDTTATVVDVNGNVIIKPLYKNLEYYKDSLFIADNERAYGVINLRGDTVVPFNYSLIEENSMTFDADTISKIKEYIFIIWQNSQRGLYSTIAGEVLPCMYDDIDTYRRGEGLYQLIKHPDRLKRAYEKIYATKKISKRRKFFKKYYAMKEDYTIRREYTYGIANKYGKVIIEPRYKLSQIDYYRKTIILTDNDGKRYFFNAAGQPVNDCYVEQDIHIDGSEDGIDFRFNEGDW